MQNIQYRSPKCLNLPKCFKSIKNAINTKLTTENHVFLRINIFRNIKAESRRNFEIYFMCLKLSFSKM